MFCVKRSFFLSGLNSWLVQTCLYIYISFHQEQRLDRSWCHDFILYLYSFYRVYVLFSAAFRELSSVQWVDIKWEFRNISNKHNNTVHSLLLWSFLIQGKLTASFTDTPSPLTQTRVRPRLVSVRLVCLRLLHPTSLQEK